MATHKKPGGRPPAGGPPDASDPDQDIRELIRAREFKAALHLLMKRHGESVYRYCCEALRDPTLAKDVHQQTFIGAYHHLNRYEGRAALRAWLFKIAHNRVLDAAKSRKRHRLRVNQGELPELEDVSPGVDEQLDDARLVDALSACMGRLKEQIRSSLLLRFQQGLTFEEMSEILEEKPGTLQARVSRAQRWLRRCIEHTAGAV
jgi:RNA polymerase sigma-70 factor (ECF subfamily)